MGREVQYTPVTAEEYASALVTYGLTEEVAVAISELFAEVFDGRNSYLTDGVQRSSRHVDELTRLYGPGLQEIDECGPRRHGTELRHVDTGL